METTILGVIGLAGGVALALAGLPWWLAVTFTLSVTASWAAADKKSLFAHLAARELKKHREDLGR